MGDLPTSIPRRTVRISAELRELAPRFLAHRRGDVDCMREAIDREDFETVRAIGHTMKGSGSAYGFDDITTLGAEIERLAKARDAQALETVVTGLIEYLDSVEVIFD
ncbi:MAG: Hpt domain-containing protein [Betaproteobacteria bacterium]|jgi:HPt (histidine-containing phosphotransfer) domain-containing protein|nr:Hpt domain-containing protein [Betaproteobacteria bacterium]